MREAPWLLKPLIVNGDAKDSIVWALTSNQRLLTQPLDQREAREENVMNSVMNECPPISQNTGTLLTLISASECLSAPLLIKSHTAPRVPWEERDGARHPEHLGLVCCSLYTLDKTLRVHRDLSREEREIQINEALVHFNYQTINHRIARNLLLLFEFCILCISVLQIDKLQMFLAREIVS